MLSVRKSQDRGNANFGWLNSKHTFSFGNYYDPNHMGFSALRVINDDIVHPGAGFDSHGHRDMEIISYILEGAIEHKDSAGNIQTLSAGEFQLMSAGKGIYHSEYNASKTQPLRFLQIWIAPNVTGDTPRYQQKNFGRAYGLSTIASPSGENHTLQIKQTAKLHQLIVKPTDSFDFQKTMGNNIYVHIIAGTVRINHTMLCEGDGAKITDENTLTFHNQSNRDTTALIFELL
ncbi:pirin family protein [Pseudoalteromonas sp. MMG013]|uniref:pirin family protein n=1 Tax=Pseudoalteromonas sp. MMG013 TaxID=2822687 RepID=UPI001B36807B|nr:pirin family protein [Pseudoalteromonas sp. MMG013]MBQ4861558.1 pirin family protein [Pseudoalteromonas sp. MMG013]